MGAAGGVAGTKSASSQRWYWANVALGVVVSCAAVVRCSTYIEPMPRDAGTLRAQTLARHEESLKVVLLLFALSWFIAAIAQKRQGRYRIYLQLLPLALLVIVVSVGLWWHLWPF